MKILIYISQVIKDMNANFTEGVVTGMLIAIASIVSFIYLLFQVKDPAADRSAHV